MSQVTTTQNHKVLGNKKLVGLVYSCPFFFPLKFALKKKKVLIKIICYIFEI